MREAPVAEVKRDFKRVLDDAERGESTVVMRHGKPVAVIGPYQAEKPRRELPKPKQPGGLLAMAGLLADWDTIDEDIAEIVASRQLEYGRPPPDFD
ncbi:MAG TPA: type II toxin-antitoxin system Phd/YefM family antitoxin [Chloroflexota bacterium]|nr:type II toxin-antitoxin system Phd/YefM family antitoxin [Chloroflexota bacterium]